MQHSRVPVMCTVFPHARRFPIWSTLDVLVANVVYHNGCSCVHILAEKSAVS